MKLLNEMGYHWRKVLVKLKLDVKINKDQQLLIVMFLLCLVLLQDRLDFLEVSKCLDRQLRRDKVNNHSNSNSLANQGLRVEFMVLPSLQLLLFPGLQDPQEVNLADLVPQDLL